MFLNRISGIRTLDLHEKRLTTSKRNAGTCALASISVDETADVIEPDRSAFDQRNVTIEVETIRAIIPSSVA